MSKAKWQIAGVSTLLLALWVVWFLKSPEIAKGVIGGSGAIDVAGQWGDSFGVFNALISSFALLGVLGTIWAQDETLKQQSATISIQQEQLKRQTEDQHRQRFESTFFELLRLLRECRDQVEIVWLTNRFKSADAFEEIARYCEISSKSEKAQTNEMALFFANHMHPRFGRELGPYFRVVYRILERIKDDNVLSENEKNEYSRIVRGQLTSSELILLGLNAQMPLAKHMPILLRDFRMLKYVPDGRARDELISVFGAEAFQGRRA